MEDEDDIEEEISRYIKDDAGEDQYVENNDGEDYGYDGEDDEDDGEEDYSAFFNLWS